MRFVLCFFALLIPAVAFSQTPSAPKPPPAKPQVAPIESLFKQMKEAETEQEADAVGDRIEKLFQQSGSASVDLLMARATVALAASDTKTAKSLVDTITDVAPDFAEGWRVRAGMQAASGDDEGAMLSLGKAVTINPRHFAAMKELAQMFEAYGNKAGALKLYRRILELSPRDQAAQFRVRALARQVEGQGI
jgi:Tfp pilus assembly protein PilF